jgi:hypothetical protein
MWVVHLRLIRAILVLVGRVHRLSIRLWVRDLMGGFLHRICGCQVS